MMYMTFQYPSNDAAVSSSQHGTPLSLPAALLKIWMAEKDVDINQSPCGMAMFVRVTCRRAMS